MRVPTRDSRMRDQEARIKRLERRVTGVEDHLSLVLETTRRINRKSTRLELSVGTLIKFLGLPPVTNEAVEAKLRRE